MINLNRNELTPLMRLKAKLEELPPPGHGHGCHNGLLGSANLARRAGLDRTSTFCRLKNAIKPGPREVPDTEIRDAIALAYDGNQESRPQPATPRKTKEPGVRGFDSEGERNRLIEAGHGWDEKKWREASPIPIPESPAEQTLNILGTLYAPDDYVFIGQRWDSAENVRKAGDWTEILAAGAGALHPPHIIPNPLTGGWAQKRSDGLSKRCDSAVAKHRIAVAEFDDMPKEEQLAFWAGLGHKIVALIDSGGKSIHAWLQVDCANAREWEEKVAQKLYKEKLIPLGVDPSCRNPSRLSRLPGITRENGNVQTLIYLNKEIR